MFIGLCGGGGICVNIYPPHQPTNFSTKHKMTNSNDIIQAIENSVFQDPERAIGVGGWVRHGDRMQTAYRPDGSRSNRPDKMTLRYRENGALFLSYNGGSWGSGFVASILKRRFGRDWIKTVCQIYGIDENNVQHVAPRRTTRYTRPEPYTIGDETNVCTIPETIFKPTLGCSRQNVLRSFLSDVFGEDVIGRVWEQYQVGTAIGGETIFWNFDRQGRCRGGKKMVYLPNGHRDREAKFPIAAVHAGLIRCGQLPKEWHFSDCLFGEHLLALHQEKPVGLVESEKTSLVCAAVWPGAVWLATGGAKRNLDRAAALLAGRRVVVFPDADAHGAWKAKFGALPGFSVNPICYDHFLKHGESWAKCDLADVLEQEYLLAEKVAEIAQKWPKN